MGQCCCWARAAPARSCWRADHALDPRPRKGSWWSLDCTTSCPSFRQRVLRSRARRLHGRGGARDGAFALADGGTLFLDEVGELPLPLQAQLLRVVQEHTYKRVGSNIWQQTDFRLVCATHRDLRQDVAAGRSARTSTTASPAGSVDLPPLRERREDILPLADHFLHALRPTRPPPLRSCGGAFLVGGTIRATCASCASWSRASAIATLGPGAVTIGDIPEDEWAEAAAAGSAGDVAGEVTLGAPPVPAGATTFDAAVFQALSQGFGLREIGRVATEAAIRVALASEDGNLRRAAKRLGVTDRALQMRRAQRVE